MAWTGALTAGILVATGGPLLPSAPAAGPVSVPATAPETAVQSAGQPASAAEIGRSAQAAQVEPLTTVAGARLQLRPEPRHVDARTAYRSESVLASPPQVPLATWAVADLDTGEILAAHRPRTRRQPASTIKLLTAVTAADRIRRAARHRVTTSEAQPLSCVCVGLTPGRRYSRDALMKGMLLVSGNDAAEALAGADPRGRDGFLRAMNRRADALGAQGTTAVNPSGLTGTGASSTARDLLVFLRAAQADRAVAPILDLGSARFGPARGAKRTIYRANPYVDATPRSEGKTGYTRAAGFNLVVSTRLRDADGTMRRIGVAAMGAPSRDASDRAVTRLTRWVARHHDSLGALGSLPAAPGARAGSQGPSS